ncbi:hypothetical protein [Streptomyces sp. NPDC059533]|uniref:hypothetical protein n=1 Tax=unclassified Streptomyces TaxID=2593676 RepID=UPI0036BC6E0B
MSPVVVVMGVSGAPGVVFVHLALDRTRAERRVAGRRRHFMPAPLVDSQYTALEPLRPDEPGVTLDATADLQSVVDEAARAIG